MGINAVTQQLKNDGYKNIARDYKSNCVNGFK